MLRTFILRPVLSTVVSIILLLLGIISYFALPVTLFPDIAPPSVTVTAVYPGANAEVVARSVANPIEESVNGVENMTYMTSNSNNDGSMVLTVYFKQGTDPDIAAVNVQNRVSKATSQLPAEVVSAGISTQKVQNGFIMFMGLYSENPKEYDEKFLQNYIKINLIPQIQRVPGVAQAQIFGAKDYSMRVWLKPDRLAANNLSPQEVLNAIRDQNIESAPGRLGENSAETFEFVLKYKGKLSLNEDYENIVIKANSDGSMLRLKDVARIEFGSLNYGANNLLDGKPAAGFAIIQTAGSNANEILDNIEHLLVDFRSTLPTGVKTEVMYNAKDFLDASIHQVRETLIIAFLLVFLVVYIFLQDLRSTLIPAIAVPVAILGTFFFLQLFGFSINLLTLFALVLAIGIVVDDAIVVVEAVHAKMEQTRWPARKATLKSMDEISGAVISITLVMMAVFIPVGFMQGPAGVFYRQFAFTLAIAIMISAINALTLSPALCALFLKPEHGEHGKKTGFGSRFFNAFNAGFRSMTNRYIGSLNFLIKRKAIAIGLLAIVSIIAFILVRKTPTGFIPTEDQGFVLYALNTPPGSSLDRTHKSTSKIDQSLRQFPSVKHTWTVDGFNFISNAAASPYAAGFIRLKEKGERGDVDNIDDITGMMYGPASELKDAGAFFFNFPTVQGFGNVSGFEFMLQDKQGRPLDQLGNNAWAFIGALMQRPEIGAAFTTFSAGNPQYKVEVDNFKAKQLGVSVSDLMQTMQIYYGSSYVSDFNRFGKYYRVVAQADVPYRTDVHSLDGIYVKNSQSEMVPVKSMVTLKRVYGPETVTRNNMFNAVTINGTPKPGYSTGDAIKAIEETAKTALPQGYGYEWTGATREEISAGDQQIYIFLLSILFVYFLLAAQYESYVLPLAVILTIPTGILGVFAFIGFAGLDNNIYVQIGMIMLIGLLAKNAILIVEFAVQRRRNGMGLLESALAGARARLRPILMTSFAFIVGLIPLVFVSKGSAVGNHSIGYSAIGGMLTGVILGVFIIPVLYVIFQFLQEKITGRPGLRVYEEEMEEELEEATV
ncbi:efflux RND transporter permease subunit [Chitinophaga barathri]|uniref:Efflux RND transporter permease subunit n=1 Tax=Chitinophaga barathri TaxID=1647451 RepID=A0A3N4MBV3_9BACT|nr:efflux RND transporter permease subunit [Chitinophaga barathri]RPD39296.1 efflux RND transporter permease subunit [Chitinophaga barathri]